MLRLSPCSKETVYQGTDSAEDRQLLEASSGPAMWRYLDNALHPSGINEEGPPATTQWYQHERSILIIETGNSGKNHINAIYPTQPHIKSNRGIKHFAGNAFLYPIAVANLI